MTDITDTLRERYSKVREEIAACCRAAGRNEGEINLVVVTKLHSVEEIMALLDLGHVKLGENRAQELVEKYTALQGYDPEPEWHFIGSLQTNKVRQVVGRTVLIHSVDSLRLARQIANRSKRMELTQEVLLQVNISGEATKSGFAPEDLVTLWPELLMLENISYRGLMTMAPLGASEKEAEKIFTAAAELLKRLRANIADPNKRRNFTVLSMGMSQDYPVAIRAGATHLRIGTAIMGERG
ncbi:MAG: YggS family pyridoxal phosphate-dependent enzyme [Clostridiaceae bacterium]|nr:YggS family pyridoxal phosphate-dependent enzyme [Clostridiaceae bacterium]